TILFVSHNMTAIEKLCKKVVWMEKGRVPMVGDAKEVVEQYLKHVYEQSGENEKMFPMVFDDLTIHGFTISQNDMATAHINPD
ncbi:hypothetical protein N4E61_14900, partial [Staphylococcus aureus]|nr:hypothetical protein [Staphylococcus aureus]